MSVTAVIGAQWGDEGKGKVIDFLCQEADMCIRFNGANNAGHTVKNPHGEFKLHLVPAGIFNPKTTCIIGNGVAIEPKALIDEMAGLQKAGISCQNLNISPRAHLIMPWHIKMDGLQEIERGAKSIGTTRRGVGPVFADKYARFGIRLGDLLKPKELEEKIEEMWSKYAKLFLYLYNEKEDIDSLRQIKEDYALYSKVIISLIADTTSLIQRALKENKNIFLEGAQGTLLDPDFGTYPQTTSSLCTAAGACQGSGISVTEIQEIIGVAKAYTTRVCEKVHPFPTEMPEDIANPFREKTHEYGSTTGRPRRIGYFDSLQVKYAAQINGFTALAITQVDNLTSLEELKICTGYSLPNGKEISVFNMEGFDFVDLREVKPIYLNLKPVGFGKDFPENPAALSDLPLPIQIYLHAIEDLVGVPIGLISYGPDRNQTIIKDRI